MPIFKLAWVASWISILLTSGLDNLKLPISLNNFRVNVVSPIPSSQLPIIALTNSSWFPFKQNKAKSKSKLEAKRGLSEFAVKTTQAWRQAVIWRDTIKTSSCVPQFDSNNVTPAIIPTAHHEPIKWQNLAESSEEMGFSQKLFQVVSYPFVDAEEVTREIPDSIVRVSSYPISTQEYQEMSFNFWDSPRPEIKPNSAAEYQIWVNKHLVAQVSSRNQAHQFAQQLRSVLDYETIDAENIQPVIIEGKPSAQLDGKVLFTLDTTFQTNPDDDLQLTAIKWINNIRVALDASPLDLVEAQQEMFQLVETGEEIGGLASWYGSYFHGRLTANGETYNMHEMTAAHPTLPLNTFLKVTNLENQSRVIVRVNDRGPYIQPRTLDLSLGAARCIDSEDDGVIRYEAVVMKSAPL